MEKIKFSQDELKMSKIDKLFQLFHLEKVDNNGWFPLKKPLPLDEVLLKISSIEEGEQQTIFPYEVGGYVLWLLIK